MRKVTKAASAFIFSIFLFSAQVQAQTGTPSPEVIPTDTTAKTLTEKVFTKVDVEASVDALQWRIHLEKNLVGPIEKAAKKGIKAGQHVVYVRFLVERDGSISNVKALNDPGFNLAAASVKVVRTGPKWNAGEQNGRKVRSYHTQPITFVIQEL